MLFIIGIMLLFAGVWMILRQYRNSRRPRVEDARVLEVNREYFELRKGQVTPRKVPVGNVEYFYRSVKYTAEIMLKQRSIKPGDSIQLSVNPDKPTEVEHYSAMRELGVGVFICLLAALMIFGSLYWSGFLD